LAKNLPWLLAEWGSTFYLPAALAPLIARDTGWIYDLVVSGVSVELLVAGLASSRVGHLIAANGGRPILAIGALLLAAGLLAIGTAPNFVWYLIGWVVIGLGMSASLYDAAFSTLGRIYGAHARTAITSVTLFGGFASTVCWPLSAFLTARFGWRGACFTYAAIQIAVALPIHLLALPPATASAAGPAIKARAPAQLRRDEYATIRAPCCGVDTRRGGPVDHGHTSPPHTAGARSRRGCSRGAWRVWDPLKSARVFSSCSSATATTPCGQ